MKPAFSPFSPGRRSPLSRDPAPPPNGTLYKAMAQADATPGVISFPTHPSSSQRLIKIPSAEPRAKCEIVRKVNKERSLHVGIREE